MIIVSHSATATLVKDLERCRAEGMAERCIYLKLAHLSNRAADWIDDVASYLEEMIGDDLGRIFLCEDGDVFIIASGLNKKKLSEVFLCVLPHLQPAPDPQGLAVLYELSVDINAVLIIAQDKYDIILDAEKLIYEERQRLKQDKIDIQQRAILNLNITQDMKQAVINKRFKRDKLEILLVDDDAFSRRMVSNVLSGPFSIQAASDGWEAITMYLKHAPDIVFLDIDMPDINGHDILSKLFEIDPVAYVVMLSGFGHQDNILRAVKRGARGFIGKPFTKEKIFQYIHSCPPVMHRQMKVNNNVQTT